MYITTSYQINSDGSLSSAYTTNHDMRRVDGYLIFFATRELKMLGGILPIF